MATTKGDNVESKQKEFFRSPLELVYNVAAKYESRTASVMPVNVEIRTEKPKLVVGSMAVDMEMHCYCDFFFL